MEIKEYMKFEDGKIIIDLKMMAVKEMMPMLEKFVADTSNPYDDKLIEMFKAFVEKK